MKASEIKVEVRMSDDFMELCHVMSQLGSLMGQAVSLMVKIRDTALPSIDQSPRSLKTKSENASCFISSNESKSDTDLMNLSSDSTSILSKSD